MVYDDIPEQHNIPAASDDGGISSRLTIETENLCRKWSLKQNPLLSDQGRKETR